MTTLFLKKKVLSTIVLVICLYAVPVTSTAALNNATLANGLAIANKGYKEALRANL